MQMSRVRSIFGRRPTMLVALALALVASLGLAGAALADDPTPEPSIFGFITDSITGEPIAGAQVMLLLGQPSGTPGGPGPAGPDAWRVTDADGYYEYLDVEPFDNRNYSVIAGADDYDAASSDNFVYAGEAPVQVDVALVPRVGPPAVTGVVVDAVTDLPLPDATVAVWYEDEGGIPGRAVDEDGTFAFWAIEPDREFRVWAEVWESDYNAASSGVLVYDGETTVEVVIALEKAPSISGTVFELGSEVPVPGATVTLLRSQPFGIPGPPSGAGQTTADENGHYAFADVEPFDDRSYTVIVDAPGYEPGESEPFVYDGSEPLVVNVFLEPQAGDPVVSGVVFDVVTALPLSQAVAWIVYDPDSQNPEPTIAQDVNEDGEFGFWNVQPNRPFQVWAESEELGYPAAGTTTLVYDGENPIEVDVALTRQLVARGIGFAAKFIGDYDPGLTDIAGLSQEARDAIKALAFYGITVGYPDGTYKPGAKVMRQHMALFLARVIKYAVDTADLEMPDDIVTPPFTDLGGLSAEAREAIALLYTLGVTKGTTATTFTPYADVTRRDMATFMVRIQDLLEKDSYATDEWFFSDVTAALDRAAHINALAAQGIVVGYGDGTYGPFDSVLRSQMALFIMRHIDENVEAGRLPALQPNQGS